jgi:glycine cleavage system transcriptional repressor
MPSQKQLKVLSAVGSDRPGLVKEISACIHRAGANIEDSRMAVLGGEFAMLVLFSGSTEELARAEAEARRTCEKVGLEASFRATQVGEGRAGHLSYRLRVSALDHPGIVEAVSAVLAPRGVNVVSLESQVVHQPLSGTPTFVLEADLHVPSGVVLAELRRALQEVSEAENLDLVLEAKT